MGGRMFLIPSELEARANIHEAFCDISLEDSYWAILLYESIVLKSDLEKSDSKESE